MTSETSARVSANPLRRRMHILERASRSFTTAESSTRNGDAESEYMQPFPSPPTSHGYDEDEEEEEEEHVSSGEDRPSSIPQTAAPFAESYEQEEEHHTPESRPWYRPSLPVVLALAPPIGNWLTGGDHLKDLLLLLLLVFYLHQLIEAPWGLYHAARPRRSPAPAVSHAPTLTAARARSELRTIEFLLLLLCLLAPVLGVVLLRSLASLTSSSSTTPISWFSTTIFAFFTALRPLRELVSRISTRTSTLHAHVHAHTAPPPSSATEELRAQVARLEADIARLARREEALYAYVEDALAPIEKGVRRVERRVGKLRTAKKERDAGVNTIFVPAQQTKPPPTYALLSWFASPSPAPVQLPPAPVLVAAGKTRRALDSIPEEGEPGPSHTAAYAYATPPVGAPPAITLVLGALVQQCAALARQAAAAGVVLALWPIWLLLLPVRAVLRFLVGVV
ncbi:hypothetical protein C8R44DRAFT_972632 [Mycena epipterygia]|nr:hypothetical protein C8R44DRAFT_972632 [Mycena epipterygia]